VRLKKQSAAGYGVQGRFVLTPLAAPSLHSNLANNVLDPRDWGLNGVRTTGSIIAGSNQLSVDDASEIAVGDKIIVELGGEVGAGGRGTVGVGGQWPALTYASNAERDADKSRPDGTVVLGERDRPDRAILRQRPAVAPLELGAGRLLLVEGAAKGATRHGDRQDRLDADARPDSDRERSRR
jgi:hypothetical protein